MAGIVVSLTIADWLRVCASEGVPFGYRVVSLPVTLYDGSCTWVYSLQAAFAAGGRERKPSERYMALLREGARENELRESWQHFLNGVPTANRDLKPPSLQLPRDYEQRPGATFV